MRSLAARSAPFASLVASTLSTVATRPMGLVNFMRAAIAFRSESEIGDFRLVVPRARRSFNNFANRSPCVTLIVTPIFWAVAGLRIGLLFFMRTLAAFLAAALIAP